DDELYFDATDRIEVVEAFTNLNGDFSKRLPLRPLILSTKPKDDNLSSDDSDF
ncbi:14321_t:CDS:1, partial [Rhizophagus irregularis]